MNPVAAESATEESREALQSPSARPHAAVRGHRLLARIEGGVAWVDAFAQKHLPVELNPLAQAGRACNFAIIAAVASGVLLLLWYSPSLQSAYTSVANARSGSLGGVVRAVHRYSSDLVMLLALVHAIRMALARKFGGARWIPWVSGVGLIGLIWFIGWTGAWLVWDQPAQQVATTSMRVLDAMPIFGEPMGRLFIADRLVPSLLFFVVFFLHMLLPLAIAVGLATHLLRVNRVKLLPSWRLALSLTIGLLAAAVVAPAPLEESARMAVKASGFTVDAWYLSPLALVLRFQHAGPWLALGGAMLAAATIPWTLGRRRAPASFQTQVDPARCHACTQCVQDCPFDAVRMIPREDGKRFASQAYVDPAKCVGCAVCVGSCDSEAMSLGWFDTRREEARIQEEVTRGLAEKPWVAFVAEDIDSGFALYRATLWRERLPQYQVCFVPTASWVRPKLVERLLAAGVRGVLVVRDAKVEAAARDGNRWVELRLAGQREPVFRPDRAKGSRACLVLDYDPARPDELAARARAWVAGVSEKSSQAPSKSIRVAALALAASALVMTAVVVGSRLRVENPTSAEPEFVLSFRALGDQQAAQAVDEAAEAAKPIHMRGRSFEKPRREDVRVTIVIDGSKEERSYVAKGISHDGPALDEWRHVLTAGRHRISVQIETGPKSVPLKWTGEVDAQPRKLHVLTFEPGSGFRLEN